MKIRNRLAIAVLCIGMLQMTGYVLNSKVLRGLGLASGISPYTKVFCEADGYEAFAASFRLEGFLKDGSRWSCDLDPEMYSRIKGPYNRRNVYGATLAFAPRLPEDLRSQLLDQAFRPGSRMRQEIGVPDEVTDLLVRITSKDQTQEWTY